MEVKTSTDSLFDTFRGVAADPYRYLSEWKQVHDRPVIGCLPMYPPEEIVHAAGFHPAILLAKDEPVTVGRAYIQAYMCSYVNSLVDIALKGDLDFLDGIVLPDTCYAIRGIAGTLKRHLTDKYLYDFVLPAVQDRQTAKRWLTGTLKDFKEDFERRFEVIITEEALRKSLALYNQNRAAVRRLYDLRRRNPAVMKLSDIVAVSIAGMVMPKAEHTFLLQELTSGLESTQPQGDRRAKVVLSGHLCDDPPNEVLRMLQELDVAVVDDDLFTGGRYYATDADLTVDPLEGLAERYLNLIPCSSRPDMSKDYGDYLVELAKKSGAQGVVIIVVKFCDPHLMDLPYLREKLEAAGIPNLSFETEMEQTPYGAIKNRLEAFLEMIG